MLAVKATSAAEPVNKLLSVVIGSSLSLIYRQTGRPSTGRKLSVSGRSGS
jgi:hypothetical protein